MFKKYGGAAFYLCKEIIEDRGQPLNAISLAQYKKCVVNSTRITTSTRKNIPDICLE